MSTDEKSEVKVPEFQTSLITDEMVEKARELVGVWLRKPALWPTLSEPISLMDIRRFAMFSVGDDNPLWSDAEYAKKTIWGRTIASPTFLFTFLDPAVNPGFPGIQSIYWGTRWEHFKPVLVGDQITSRTRMIDLQEKTGKHAPRFFVEVIESTFVNQRMEIVARTEDDILRIPRSRSGAGLRGFEEKKAQGRWKYKPEEIEEITQAYYNEDRRGGTPRYWEEVNVGDLLPKIVKGPLTLVDIVAFYAGRRSLYNPLKLAFLERKRHPKNVYVSPVTGVPVHPACGHFDIEIAHEIGMPGTYDQGWMRVNWMGHLVSNWMSDWGFVRNLNVRLLLPNLVGDVTWVNGKVTGKSIRNGEHVVELECYGQNQRGEKNMDATAVVRLPSKDPTDKYAF